ncbi:MAG: Gfo/Idh/MocA family oxidoreductase [Clostridia bacterium]|nr:Gfo/Idh/MocA family oxidoreductase [Clostridia bacterium]
MKYPLTVAVIGSGFMGETHLGVFVNKAQRVILCSNDPEKGQALADRYGCAFYSNHRQMLEAERIDLVSICVPTPLHASISIDCLNAGTHVLCEKPFASTLAEAEDMIRAAKAANKQLMIAHCVRFSRYYHYLRSCIADQRYGKLMYLHLFRHSAAPGWSASNWLSDPRISGGVVRDLHIHDTDLIKHVLGMPGSVYTTGDHLSCSTSYAYGTDLSVTASGSWRTTKSFAFDSGFDASFEGAVLQLKNGTLRLLTEEGGQDPLENEEFPHYLQSLNDYENEIEYFCHCVANGCSPDLCMPTDTLESLRVNLAESESLATGGIVALK